MQVREVVRAVILDGDGRVLLFRISNSPDGEAWALPGGAVEAGEDDTAALVRELREELQMRTARVGGRVADWELPFSRDGETTLWRTRAYAVAPTDDLVTPDFARWWSPAELINSAQRVVPPQLGEILANCL